MGTCNAMHLVCTGIKEQLVGCVHVNKPLHLLHDYSPNYDTILSSPPFPSIPPLKLCTHHKGTLYLQQDSAYLVSSALCLFTVAGPLFIFPALDLYYQKALQVCSAKVNLEGSLIVYPL